MNTPFEPCRNEGLGRLASFIAQSLRDYPKARNFDFGPDRRNNVSMLSPYIRHRLVLEREVLEATLQRHSLATSKTFVQEVFWRTYFKGWMEQHPEVWIDYRSNVAGLIRALDSDPELMQRYADATSGNTGIDCLDSWARELKQTGYLHNHARMWFASIWIFTLRLPWQLGADFLYRHLVDGDPASNTLSWRWVAGLHTKGKNYLAMSSNIARYTDRRFNPDGKLSTAAPPLQEPHVFPLRELPLPDDLPADGEYGLLITEEDGCAETLPLDHRPKTILGAMATRQRSPLAVGQPAKDFAVGAVADALRRATQHFAVDGQLAETGDWSNLLAEWAEQHQLKTIVTGYAPVGPVAELLSIARGHLEKQGVRLAQVRRPYDSLTWPHATKGYFKLKDKIPHLLGQLDIKAADEPAEPRTAVV